MHSESRQWWRCVDGTPRLNHQVLSELLVSNSSKAENSVHPAFRLRIGTGMLRASGILVVWSHTFAMHSSYSKLKKRGLDA